MRAGRAVGDRSPEHQYGTHKAVNCVPTGAALTQGPGAPRGVETPMGALAKLPELYGATEPQGAHWQAMPHRCTVAAAPR
jgi:hypothetical protein